jgi:hypothetical protein
VKRAPKPSSVPNPTSFVVAYNYYFLKVLHRPSNSIDSVPNFPTAGLAGYDANKAMIQQAMPLPGKIIEGKAKKLMSLFTYLGCFISHISIPLLLSWLA